MKLAVTRAGEGAPLVLLHALGAHRGVWDPVLPHLIGEREVFAFDLPGFGDSEPFADGAATPARIAAVIATEMQRLGVAVYAAAGNSFGGWTALEMGLRGDARTVTAIAPAGLWRGPLVPRPLIGQLFARAFYPLLPVLVHSAAIRRVLLTTQMAHPERVPRADVLALLRKYARAKGLKPAQRAMRAGHFSELDRIAVPVTLVWPEHDRLIARLRRSPAQIRHVVLPGCGHLPQWDDPRLVAEALLAGSAAELRRAA